MVHGPDYTLRIAGNQGGGHGIQPLRSRTHRNLIVDQPIPAGYRSPAQQIPTLQLPATPPTGLQRQLNPPGRPRPGSENRTVRFPPHRGSGAIGARWMADT